MKPALKTCMMKLKLRISDNSFSLRPINALVLPLIALLACTNTGKQHLFKTELKRSRDSFVAKAQKGMIATAHPLASRAGLKMLAAGGNAIDAVTAASFVISVVRPQSTGIGGGGFMLYFDKKSSQTRVYDFRERAPLKASKDMYLDKKTFEPLDYIYKGVRIPRSSVNGHMSVGVPGLVAGLVETHKTYGKLPLAKVVQPAIKIAEEGFEVYPSLASAIKFRQKVLQNFPASREIFIPNGKALTVGDMLVQKDLAKTLKAIANKGKAGFYEGEIGNLLLKELGHGGIITKEDFEAYKVKERLPVEGSYRGHKIVSMPPPSSGGVHIIQILNILAQDPLPSLEPQSPQRLHLLAEAMRRAYADRATYLGDPEFTQVPIKGLISPEYGRTLRASIQAKLASPSKSVSAGNPLPFESSSTTHISVVDSEGNAVSTTQTINYAFGSCVVAKGTGVVLNNEMDDFSIKPGVPNSYGLIGGKANAVAAKKTMLSSMSPTLVFDPDNKLKLVVGSPGGSRIITATLQTILNTIDHKMSLADAVHTYRIHHQWLPDEIRIEKGGMTEDTKAELESYGHVIKEHRGSIGDVQAIAWEGANWVGVSDTRSDGVPMGFGPAAKLQKPKS